VYGRIADAYRYQVIARGLSEQHAQQRALQRAAVAEQTDVMLAARAQARRFLVTTQVAGWLPADPAPRTVRQRIMRAVRGRRRPGLPRGPVTSSPWSWRRSRVA
jgi:hypothetical protein